MNSRWKNGLATKRSKVAAAILWIGALRGFMSFPAGYVVFNGFLSHPTVPTPVVGQTVPYEVKGRTFYVTKHEQELATAISIGRWSVLVLILLAALIDREIVTHAGIISRRI